MPDQSVEVRNFVLACYAVSLILGETILGTQIRAKTVQNYVDDAALLFRIRRLPWIPLLSTDHVKLIITTLTKYESVPNRRNMISDAMMHHLQNQLSTVDQDSNFAAIFGLQCTGCWAGTLEPENLNGANRLNPISNVSWNGHLNRLSRSSTPTSPSSMVTSDARALITSQTPSRYTMFASNGENKRTATTTKILTSRVTTNTQTFAPSKRQSVSFNERSAYTLPLTILLQCTVTQLDNDGSSPTPKWRGYFVPQHRLCTTSRQRTLLLLSGLHIPSESLRQTCSTGSALQTRSFRSDYGGKAPLSSTIFAIQSIRQTSTPH